MSSRTDRSESLVVYGTHGRIEVPKAYNPPNSGPHAIRLFRGNELAKTKTYNDAFQFALQVRNKLLDAYREVMRMSV